MPLYTVSISFFELETNVSAKNKTEAKKKVYELMKNWPSTKFVDKKQTYVEKAITTASQMPNIKGI